MFYNGVLFDKKSRIISCKKPFQKDPTIIDYEQDSDEEWEELHGENLEDDDQLIEEEMMEVQEDEAEMMNRENYTQLSFPDASNTPHAGVSNLIRQRLAFRSQYKEDDPDLRKEGFIVADDYFS